MEDLLVHDSPKGTSLVSSQEKNRMYRHKK